MLNKDHTFIWLLTQHDSRWYDTYDSCVVAADTEEEARLITPDGNPFKREFRIGPNSKWARRPEDVKVEKIGVGKPSLRGKVICSSFNAG